MTNRAPTGPATAAWPVMARAVIRPVLGLPGYAAIGIALGFTGLGVFIDLQRVSGLGVVFKGCYLVGCVLGVCWVKRRALFGPMVQPPLLLAVAVPSVVLAAGDPGDGGLAARLLAIGTPLLNGFPTMAVTTALVIAIGVVRYLVEKSPTEPERTAEPAVAPANPRRRFAERSASSAGPRDSGPAPESDLRRAEQRPF